MSSAAAKSPAILGCYSCASGGCLLAGPRGQAWPQVHYPGVVRGARAGLSAARGGLAGTG
jgi:hypothetical protein